MSSWLLVIITLIYWGAGIDALIEDGNWQYAGLCITYGVANLFLIALNLKGNL